MTLNSSFLNDHVLHVIQANVENITVYRKLCVKLTVMRDWEGYLTFDLSLLALYKGNKKKYDVT